MSIETNKPEDNYLKYKAIEDVFQTKYYIDFYQRDYTWANENVYALLEDTYHRFDLTYSKESETNPDFIKRNYKWYYLNSYIINKQNNRTCIVDGQQRFSTLTLLLIKLYHLAKSKDLNDARIDSIKNLICKATSRGLEFWMGGNDRSLTLEDLYKNQRNSKPERKLNPSELNLYYRYEIVSDYLDEKFKNNDLHYLECFIIYFLTNVKLVEIEIKESDDVAMVFEVINAKGQKLKSHEILKAQLLSQIPKDELDEYLNYWNAACILLRLSGLKYPNVEDPVDAFFTYFFRARYTKTTTEIQNFKDYHKTIFSREWQERLPFKKDVNFVKRFIKDEFIYYAKTIGEIVNSSFDDNKYIHFNLKINEITNLYLILLSCIKVNDNQYDEKVKLLSKLVDRHYVVLRLQGCYDSNNFNRQITSFVIKLRDKDDLIEIKNEFDESLINDINKMRSSNSTEFMTYNFFKDLKVGNSNKNFVRYLFARIEEFLCQEMNHNQFAGYNTLVSSRKYHIEHILARNAENFEVFGNEDYFNEQRDKLGGLLLLKKGDNGMSLNEVYSEKLKTYSNDTLLARTLTKNFYHNNSGLRDFSRNYSEISFSHIDNFDEDALEKRQKLIFDISSRIWGEAYLMSN